MMRGLRLNVHLLERQGRSDGARFPPWSSGATSKIFAVVVGDGGRVVRSRRARTGRTRSRCTWSASSRPCARGGSPAAADSGRRPRTACRPGSGCRSKSERRGPVPGATAARKAWPGRGTAAGRMRQRLREAAQSGRVEMNAVFKGARQLGRLDGNILLVSENVAERHTDEFYVVFLNKLYDFAHGGIHTESLLLLLSGQAKKLRLQRGSFSVPV